MASKGLDDDVQQHFFRVRASSSGVIESYSKFGGGTSCIHDGFEKVALVVGLYV